MRQVFTPVQPLPADPAHPRAGQAGYVVSVPADKPEEVGVKWDTDGAVTVEAVAALRQLG